MSAPHDQEPTQEELQAYFAELREAPTQELLMQALSVLGTGAEVKVGLPDARVLIDAMESVLRVATPMLGEVAEQLAQAVVQLKTNQVQAEQMMAAQDSEGDGDADSDDSSQGAPPATAPPPPAAPQQPATAKLWIPGRD